MLVTTESRLAIFVNICANIDPRSQTIIIWFYCWW